mmetsp:Transcript_32861/g.79883  ORF Transcript_32861/g.79883 Transcript_32861/m.79883 type:complete len:259 (+) Transcript_32861:1963-2739(+)
MKDQVHPELRHHPPQHQLHQRRLLLFHLVRAPELPRHRQQVPILRFLRHLVLPGDKISQEALPKLVVRRTIPSRFHSVVKTTTTSRRPRRLPAVPTSQLSLRNRRKPIVQMDQPLVHLVRLQIQHLVLSQHLLLLGHSRVHSQLLRSLDRLLRQLSHNLDRHKVQHKHKLRLLVSTTLPSNRRRLEDSKMHLVHHQAQARPIHHQIKIHSPLLASAIQQLHHSQQVRTVVRQLQGLVRRRLRSVEVLKILPEQTYHIL